MYWYGRRDITWHKNWSLSIWFSFSFMRKCLVRTLQQPVSRDILTQEAHEVEK